MSDPLSRLCQDGHCAMTTRLYYTDAMRATFDAAVVACDATSGRFEVVLDQTAFYPTSGGQPFDTGTLGGVRVVDVVDREDGDAWRTSWTARCRGRPRAPASIDWARRFDHMQQHTGQHVLSAAFDRRCGVRTVSFHLGAGRVDDRPGARGHGGRDRRGGVRPRARVVWDDRPVTVRFVDRRGGRSPAAAQGVRRAPARCGWSRSPDFDLSACGGTHVPRTGMVGVIAVAGWERFKGGSRVGVRLRRPRAAVARASARRRRDGVAAAVGGG